MTKKKTNNTKQPAPKKKSSDIPLENIPERMTGKKYYADEFKLEAVKRFQAGQPAEAIAADMGIPTGSMINKWARRVSEGRPVSQRPREHVPPKGKAPDAQADITASIRAGIAAASKARDDRLEVAAFIVENDGGTKEAADLAKKIRAMKRTHGNEAT